MTVRIRSTLDLLAGRVLAVLAVLAVVALTLGGVEQAWAAPPRVSPMATVTQTVGLAEVSITYSRPSARGREIFGGLVPLGKVWRTGANEATTLTLSHDAKIGGKEVAAGTYALFTIPDFESCTIILNKQAKQWGSMRHDAEQDALRADATVAEVPHVEQFTIGFSDVSSDSATVGLAWEESHASFEIEFDTHAIAKVMAKEEVAADNADSGAAFSWANYFYQEGIDDGQALEWANRSVKERSSYWAVALQARLLARTGSTSDAIVAAKKAAELGAKSQEERPNARLQADLDKLTEELKSWASAG